MDRLKLYIFFAFLSVITISCKENKKIDLSKSWKIAYSDNINFKKPNFDDSKWDKINLPIQTNKSVKVLWIRNSVIIPLKDFKNPAIYLGKIIDSDIVYFNGIIIGRTGKEPPKYVPMWNYHRSYIIPPAIVKFDRENTIAIRAYAEIDPKFSDEPFIASYDSAFTYKSYLNLLTRYTAMVVGTIVFLFGLFTLFKFLLYRDKNNSLHFALISILWAILSIQFYIFNFGEYYNLKEKIYFSFLALEISFIYFFLEKKLDVVMKPLRVIIIIITSLMLYTVYSTPLNVYMGPDNYFFIGLLGIIEQLIWGILIIYAILKKRQNSIIIAVGYSLFMAGVVHDALAISGFFIIDYYFIKLSYPALLFSFAIIMLRNYSGMEKKLELMEEISKKNKLINNQKKELEERNSTLENDLKLAKTIQQKFLSKKIPANYVYAIYKPMEAIGGDYYEFIKFRDPDLLGIFISDVSGHGVPAALITAMLKSFIEQSGKRKKNPAELINYLNDSLIELTGMNFITVFYGIYNKKTRSLTYVNAGHNPPFLIKENKVSCFYGKRSVALAVFDKEMLLEHNKLYENNEIIFEKETTIIMYTDGLTEAKNIDTPENEFDEKELIPLLGSIDKDSPKDFTHEIYNNLVKFRGSESFHDDVCIICLKT